MSGNVEIICLSVCFNLQKSLRLKTDVPPDSPCLFQMEPQVDGHLQQGQLHLNSGKILHL